jgi:hypothetical protein
MGCRAPHAVASVLIFFLAGGADAAPQAGAPSAPLTPGQLAIRSLTPGADLTSAVTAALASDQPGLRIGAARLEAALGQPEASVDAALR